MKNEQMLEKDQMLELLKKEYEHAQDCMMRNREIHDEKMKDFYYGARQAVGNIILQSGLMTITELQKFLDKINEKYDD